MNADDLLDSTLSKEEKRRIEIGIRLQGLRLALAYVKEQHDNIYASRQKLVDEILNLEEEKEQINQGQLILE